MLYRLTLLTLMAASENQLGPGDHSRSLEVDGRPVR
jgi:hypothetical protein